jgi:hypothetical protein
MQMKPVLWRLSSEMDQRLVGQAAVDHSLFRELSYQALSRQSTGRWTDLGTYGA